MIVPVFKKVGVIPEQYQKKENVENNYFYSFKTTTKSSPNRLDFFILLNIISMRHLTPSQKIILNNKKIRLTIELLLASGMKLEDIIKKSKNNNNLQVLSAAREMKLEKILNNKK